MLTKNNKDCVMHVLVVRLLEDGVLDVLEAIIFIGNYPFLDLIDSRVGEIDVRSVVFFVLDSLVYVYLA